LRQRARSHRSHEGIDQFLLLGAVMRQRKTRPPGQPRSTRQARVFVEPPGSSHLVSENASATEPASLLTISAADDGAQLTTFDK
jgi:hypothetical protein